MVTSICFRQLDQIHFHGFMKISQQKSFFTQQKECLLQNSNKIKIVWHNIIFICNPVVVDQGDISGGFYFHPHFLMYFLFEVKIVLKIYMMTSVNYSGTVIFTKVHRGHIFKVHNSYKETWWWLGVLALLWLRYNLCWR